MATSLSNASTLEWAGSGDGTQPVVKDYAEGTSETFKKGDLVAFDQSENGLVIVPQGDGGVYGDTSDNEQANNTDFLGIALKDATGTSGSLIPVLIPRSTDYFSAVLFGTDNTTIVAPDVDNIGTLCELIKGDSNNGSVTGVLEDTNGGIWVKIIDLVRQDRPLAGATPANEATYSAGDRVLVQFQTSALDGVGYVA